MYINDKGQATVSKSIKIEKDAFKSNDTAIYWLGGGGVFIHSCETNLMIDPVLEGFDMPLLYDIPIDVLDVPSLDAIMITHIDNDYFSKMTCHDLENVCLSYHDPGYVADVMEEEGFNYNKHSIGEQFMVNDIRVTLTRAKHNWQNDVKKWQYRYWEESDYCGYELHTKDGCIWMPGDSKLLEEHLHREDVDVILFDFADNDWHITFDGAIQLANAYPNADLICIHWGCVDAPQMTPFNGNPQNLIKHIINPERLYILNPGEKYVLKK